MLVFQGSVLQKEPSGPKTDRRYLYGLAGRLFSNQRPPAAGVNRPMIIQPNITAMGLIRPGSSPGGISWLLGPYLKSRLRQAPCSAPKPHHILLSHPSLAVDHSRVRCSLSSFYSRILTVSCQLEGWAAVELVRNIAISRTPVNENTIQCKEAERSSLLL